MFLITRLPDCNDILHLPAQPLTIISWKYDINRPHHRMAIWYLPNQSHYVRYISYQQRSDHAWNVSSMVAIN